MIQKSKITGTRNEVLDVTDMIKRIDFDPKLDNSRRQILSKINQVWEVWGEKNDSMTPFTRLINNLPTTFHKYQQSRGLRKDLIYRYSFSLGKHYFSSDGSQNYLLFKPINISGHIH